MSTTTEITFAGRVNIEIVRGDSHDNADGRAIDITKPTGAVWPTLISGWTVVMTLKLDPNNESGGASSLSVTGSVVQSSGDSQKVRFEPTAAQTATLAVGVNAYTFDVQASSGTKRATLVIGTVNVIGDQNIS